MRMQTDVTDLLQGHHAGLIWGYRFAEDGSAEALDGPAADAALASGDGWVWLHFNLADTRTRARLASLPGVPPAALALLLDSDERTQMEVWSDAIAGVVADFEHDDQPDPRQLARLRFVMAPHLFISARRHGLRSVRSLHEELRDGRRFQGVPQLFSAIIHGFAASLAAVSRNLGDRLDAMEDALLIDDDGEELNSLGIVRRQSVRLHRQAAPLHSMLTALLEEPPPWFTAEAARDCSRVERRVASVTADLNALQARAHALQDEVAGRQAAKANRRLALLSGMTALLLPPTLVTGFFGMNTEGLAFRDNPHGTLYAFSLVLLAGVLMLPLLRRLKLF